VWAAGSVDYTTGHLEASNGSATITGIGTRWNVYLAGRELVAAGRTYTVLAVDEENQTATISPAWQGATDSYVVYSIRPYQGNANLIQFSLSGYPESWPIENLFGLPQDDDDITGLVKFGDALYVLKERHIYRIAQGADPVRDAEVKPACERGCVGHRCAVPVGGFLFCLDRQGIHAFAGSASPEQVNTPVADLWRIEADWLRLNWDADPCLWHGVHHEELGIIRWYVAMGGSPSPRHAICLDYRKNRWWAEEYPVAITASCLSGSVTGRPILGAQDGRLLTSDVGPLDLRVGDLAATRLTVVESLSAYTVQVNADVPNMVGAPLAIVEGRGRGQVRRLAAFTDDILEVDAPFIEEPDTSSVIQIGAVPYAFTTGDVSLEGDEVLPTQAVVLKYAPTGVADPEAFVGDNDEPVRTPLVTHLAVSRDGKPLRNDLTAFWGSARRRKSDPYVIEANLADSAALARVELDKRREADLPQDFSLQVAVQGFSGLERPRFLGVYLVG